MPTIPPIRSYPLPGPDDLPAPLVDWEPRADRAVLLVHDMQKFFLRPFDDAPDLRKTLVEQCTRLRERCASLGIPVAYTAQPGRMTPPERGLLMDFWGPGMTGSPEDREVVAPLAPGPEDWMFTKWRYSAFHRSDLLGRMRALGRDQLIVCGVYAHVGVLMTAVDAYSNDIRVFLPADAVADFDAERHRWALEYTALRCGRVTLTDRLLDALAPAGGAGAGVGG
ncbi:isochorismatase family protein [Nocardiopsis sp. NPDC057823]|uniref:isochorismatase family protein n=1 Tax=Nocardiopsis sp. NPDC057823 TaxID=3346256 RepID=UPI0036705A56